MNGAARSPRQAARQQLFQAEEVCMEGRREGALPHPICQLCMFVEALCVCVCARLSDCVKVCVCICQLCMFVCVCLHSPISFSSWLCQSVVLQKRAASRCSWFLNHRKDLNNSLHRFYLFFSPESPASFNYKPILVLGTLIAVRILSK